MIFSIYSYICQEVVLSDYLLVPRPEEVGLVNKTGLVKTVTEGQTEFQQTYVKSMETDIMIDR